MRACCCFASCPLMPMFLLMITTSAAWVFPNSRVPRKDSANRVPSTLETHRLRVPAPRAAAFFAPSTLPSTARAFILHTDNEQNRGHIDRAPRSRALRCRGTTRHARRGHDRGPRSHHLWAQRPVFVTHVTQWVTHSRHTAFAHIPPRIGHNRRPRALHAQEFEGH
jgi:hypothetical protein